jgi:hypothetical protein
MIAVAMSIIALTNEAQLIDLANKHLGYELKMSL